VTVKGRLAKYDGSLQIAAYALDNIPLDVRVTMAGGGDGQAMSGAYPPAGSPTVVSAAHQAEYGYTAVNAHPEQLGTALQFTVTTVVEAPPYFTYTSPDGGVSPEGFQIDDGVWVDDSNIYSSCIKPILDGGPLMLSGVTGMWDRYQDYYGVGPDGGYAHVYPVLVLQQCSDLGLAPDAG